MNPMQQAKPTRLAVIGLGNMGVSVAAAALQRGLQVVAMDIDRAKVEMTAHGQCVVPEPGITEVFQAACREGRLRATTDLADTIAGSDICFVAVPTPPNDLGDIEYKHLLTLLKDMREPIAARDQRYDVVLGSTVFPGITREKLLPALSPLQLGKQFQFAVCPVFLRAGNGLEDYLDPGRIVVGMEGSNQNGIRDYFHALFPDRRDIWFVDYDTSECVKAVHNAWMSMKVVFANETGRWCKANNVDGRTVMDIVLSDRKRLLSRSHLKPGPPYSGPCLPKDALALRRQLQQSGTDCPLFVAVHQSNLNHKQDLFQRVVDACPRGGTIGVLGVSFKPDFNDPRWSIATEMIRFAQQKGHDVRAFDRAFVDCSRKQFELACRGSRHLHNLHSVVNRSLRDVWGTCSAVFLNMSLNDAEWKVIEQWQRNSKAPRTVVDIYGTPHNEALAELPGATYHGAAWLPPTQREHTSVEIEAKELLTI